MHIPYQHQPRIASTTTPFFRPQARDTARETARVTQSAVPCFSGPQSGRLRSSLLLSLLIASCFGGWFATETARSQDFDPRLFAQENLVAWCIVPFDSQKRNPEQRAQMLDALGIKRLAYDYRAEHVPSFEEEIVTMKKHGIDMTAWWFPGAMNEEAKHILSLIQKHDIHPQLWVMGGGDPAMNEAQTLAFIQSEVERIRPIAIAAQEAGCKVALYNHGAWFGIPENQVRLIHAIDMPNVGIVYNLHHAHDQLDRLEAILKTIQPHLLAINLNGMQTDGERLGKKILPIGQGDRDREVLRRIAASGFQGPVGILNHTDLDAAVRLRENLDGLKKLTAELTKP